MPDSTRPLLRQIEALQVSRFPGTAVPRCILDQCGSIALVVTFILHTSYSSYSYECSISEMQESAAMRTEAWSGVERSLNSRLQVRKIHFFLQEKDLD
jgi:hypothetical protein